MKVMIPIRKNIITSRKEKSMNIEKLKETEENFFATYPFGDEDPQMKEIAKKHKVEKMHVFAQENFAPECFLHPEVVFAAMGKIVSRSSLVSVFEKPKFRDFAQTANPLDQQEMVDGLYEFLHGDQEDGFERMLRTLGRYKLAKWVLLTIIPVYYNPKHEVLIKPTTVKAIIEHYELDGLKYSPKPTYAFYDRYRETLNGMKKHLDYFCDYDNAAFSGFLYFSMKQ